MERVYEAYIQAKNLSIGISIGLIAMHLQTSLKSKATENITEKEESNLKLKAQKVNEFTRNYDE